MYKSFFDKQRDNEMKSFLLEVSKSGNIKTYKKDQIIETLDKCIYIIQYGKVCKSYYSKDGREKIMCFISLGGMFGEKEYFEGSTTNTTIRTIRETCVSALNEEIIEEILMKHPIVYRYFLLNIIRQSRIVESQLISATFGDSRGKVADVLLRLYYQDGSNRNREVKILQKKYTHEEIAKILGCSRVTVTCAFNEFEKNSLIEIDGKDITIKDTDGLQKYVTW